MIRIGKICNVIPSFSFQVYFQNDEQRRIKLADFGLAQIYSGPMYTVCGTPTYVAPEILAETGYGIKVDIWYA